MHLYGATFSLISLLSVQVSKLLVLFSCFVIIVQRNSTAWALFKLLFNKVNRILLLMILNYSFSSKEHLVKIASHNLHYNKCLK